MSYLILNPKTLEADIATIKNHIEHNGAVVFSEVTNRKVTEKFTKYTCTYFIDPQHTFSGQGGNPDNMETQFSEMSATLYAIKFKERIQSFLQSYSKVLYILEKVDMDALAAVVICEIELTSTLIDNANKIHSVDCHIMPTEWNPNHIQEFEVKWTNILGSAISDFKVPIEQRVSIMEDFLLTEKLPEQYRTSVEQEWLLLQQATVENISNITVITSNAKGTAGLVYKQAPYGIAYCKNFMGKGAKFTIMEFQGTKYLKLAEFFNHMNANFPEESGTWGGNIKAGVGGSPIPCSLSKETVAAELAKFVL